MQENIRIVIVGDKLPMLLAFLIATALCTSSSLAQWEGIGEGTYHPPFVLHYDNADNRLYAGGAFRWMLPDSLIVNGITYWENGIWHSMGDGVQAGGTLLPPIFTIEKSGNSILIGGQFEHVDTLTNVGGIAQWNQNEWQRVGNQEIIANQILWIQELDGEVHALGTIAFLDQQPANNWIIFDGMDWSVGDTSEPWSFYTNAIARYNNKLHIGGNFTTISGGNDLVAESVGGAWSELGLGLLGDPWVNELAEYAGHLWVAGEFYAGAGNAATGLMVWDGVQWLDPFPDITFLGQCKDLEIANGSIYFIGPIQVPGLSGIYRFGKFDGNELCIFGGEGVGASSFACSSDTMYISTTKHIRWNDPSSLEVNYLAKFPLDAPNDTCFTVAVGVEEQALRQDENFTIYPNPANEVLNISGSGYGVNSKVQLFNTIGEIVLASNMPKSGTLDISSLRTGVYLVRLIDQHGRFVSAQRFIKN